MIIDKIKNLNLYAFNNPGIHKAFEFIKNFDFEKLQDGRYEIESNDVYAIVSTYETKDRRDSICEAHRKYIDVQYVAKGKELLGYLNFHNQKIHEEYNEEKDCLLFDAEPSFINFTENMFAVFYPDDLHMPGIMLKEKSPVKKVVVKVKI
jgi:YhcH/YjgK/YiaL family protein